MPLPTPTDVGRDRSVSALLSRVRVKLPSGIEYNGSRDETGLPQGKGSLRWSDGSHYEGNFTDGKMSGQGVLQTAGGEEYVGEFEDGLQHGQGTINYANGDVFQGTFRNGNRIHGKHVFKESGDIYEGEFFQDMFSGKGTFEEVARRVIYTGDFLKGLPHGEGTISQNASPGQDSLFVDIGDSGADATGEAQFSISVTFCANEALRAASKSLPRLPVPSGHLRHEKLIRTWSYSGGFTFGVPEGCAMRRAGAYFLSDTLHREGKYVFGKNRWYDGAVRCAICHGYGTLCWDAEVYTGLWRSGVRHGRGELTDGDGMLWVTDWADGIQLLKGNPEQEAARLQAFARMKFERADFCWCFSKTPTLQGLIRLRLARNAYVQCPKAGTSWQQPDTGTLNASLRPRWVQILQGYVRAGTSRRHMCALKDSAVTASAFIRRRLCLMMRAHWKDLSRPLINDTHSRLSAWLGPKYWIKTDDGWLGGGGGVSNHNSCHALNVHIPKRMQKVASRLLGVSGRWSRGDGVSGKCSVGNLISSLAQQQESGVESPVSHPEVLAKSSQSVPVKLLVSQTGWLSRGAAWTKFQRERNPSARILQAVMRRKLQILNYEDLRNAARIMQKMERGTSTRRNISRMRVDEYDPTDVSRFQRVDFVQAPQKPLPQRRKFLLEQAAKRTIRNPTGS